MKKNIKKIVFNSFNWGKRGAKVSPWRGGAKVSTLKSKKSGEPRSPLWGGGAKVSTFGGRSAHFARRFGGICGAVFGANKYPRAVIFPPCPPDDCDQVAGVFSPPINFNDTPATKNRYRYRTSKRKNKAIFLSKPK